MKIRITFGLGILAALLPLVGAVESNKTIRPNVVVMMVDDMGFAGPSTAPYGNPNYKTPGMDRLAREGLLFTDFHSSGTVCSPTRAGLLTGRYQQRVGVEAVIHPRSTHPEHRKGLHKSEVTFAELFKMAGYTTGMVGKWHLGYAGENPEYHPQNHGFDYFKGYHSGNIDYINHWGDHMKHDWWHGRKETKEKGYTTHLINQYALEFIEQNKDKPFCLYIAHESPHAPVQGPNDPIQRGPGAQKRTTPHAEAMKQMILEMDKGVEQVRAKLVELGLEKNTLFLFFSDNGDSLRTATGHPNHRGSKGSVYEGGTRVPAIAWWPGKIKPGTSTDALSITLDVMPTILSVAGIEKPKNRALDGIDLSSVLFEQKKTLPPRPLYWGSLSNSGARSEALRDGPWKLVVQHPKAKPGTFANEQVELFRLDKDISENINLAAEEPKRAAAMLKQLKAWYADTQKTATYQPDGWIRKPRVDTTFFNGKDLKYWSTSQEKYWSVKDDAIVGHSAMNVPKNEFIWADGEVRDFYLAVDVKLTPDNRNAGIQFRSKKADATGQALGYQADVGAGVWGKLYHEHGRGKLDWNNRAAKAVKRDDWNRYEILAVGHKIWTAINGTLCVAIEDPEGELSGKIAFQVHAGPPQTVHYRPVKLVHDPKLELPGLNENQLLDALPKKVVKEDKPKPKPGWTPQVTAWRTKLDANDPGMIGKWFANVFDDSKWKRMKLPTFYETAGLPGHDGTVWFRRAIDIPGPHAGKPLTLELGPIDDMDMTWFNGIQVGGIERPGFWTAPRKYTVPGKLVKTGRNVITVRVIDHGWSGGFGAKTTQMRMSASGLKPVSIAGSWKYQEGITLKALELGALTNPTPPKPIPPPPPAPSLVRPLAKTTSPAPAFTNGFQIEGDANIVIVGSANAAESQRHGYLETLLTAAHPAQRLAIRNMAWPADTVYQQQRPRNFFSAIKPSYGEADRRKPLPANIVLVWLGQAESLDGPTRLDDFAKAYEQTLEQLSSRTRRLVLITPVPFEDPLDLGLEVETRNANLKQYATAIRRLNQARNLPIVDLTAALLSQAATRDGVTLSSHGQWLAARAIATQLGLAAVSANIRVTETGELFPVSTEALRQVVLRKNRLWRQFWLPTNWAFLYGNRQAQASSRDHRDASFRWFPEEVQSIVPRLEQMDSLIQAKARQVTD